MLVLVVLAILYHSVGRVRVAINGVLGASTLNDIEEGRCLSEIISVQDIRGESAGSLKAAWARFQTF